MFHLVFDLQMPSLVREARVLRFIHNQIDFGVLDDIHDGCPPFAEHCFWPSVRQCICGEVFDDDTTLPITDRALNIHAKRRVHFQKVKKYEEGPEGMKLDEAYEWC